MLGLRSLGIAACGRRSVFSRIGGVFHYGIRCLSNLEASRSRVGDEKGPVLLSEHDVESGVLSLTLNRPRQRNALSDELLESLCSELMSLQKDNCTKVRCVVIQAAGPVFCSGHDLKEMIQGAASTKRYQKLFLKCSQVMQLVEEIPQPVIAAVHGVATAAGCQLAAACDLVVASQSAKFATPGVSIGLFCSTPAVSLVRSVGRKAAMDMLLTGRLVSSEEALRMGLVSRIVDKEDGDDNGRLSVATAANDIARDIASRSGPALKIGKETFRKQCELDLNAAYAIASDAMTRNMQTDDAQGGIRNFLDKKKPKWTHS